MEKMMRDTIANALKDALKARDACRVSTLRLIQATLKDRDIANRGEGKGPATNDEILAIIQKMVKQREESFAIYAQAGRADLATVEKEEIDILNEFLPKPLSEEDVAAAIEAAIVSSGAEGPKDMGKVMAVLKERYPGQMDFAKASGVVKDLLK